MEVAWCAEHGIPHSELLGWEPEDRSKLLAHLIDESQRCHMCGTSEWEWDEDRGAYTPATRLCRGCQLLDAAKEDYKPSPGIRMILIPSAKAQQITSRGFGSRRG